eukprot:3313314-Prymnesium_polylepis.1
MSEFVSCWRATRRLELYAADPGRAVIANRSLDGAPRRRRPGSGPKTLSLLRGPARWSMPAGWMDDAR